MKATRFIMTLIAAASLMFVSCGKDDNNSDGGGNASGSKELANTEWMLDNPDDAVFYHQHVVYKFTFGPTNEATYSFTITDIESVMAGTYDYKDGSGTAYLKYVSQPEDKNEYRFPFKVNGNTLTLKVSGRDINLSKVLNKVEISDGALPGSFAVSATRKVHFSMGNLQFTTEGSHVCADGNTQPGTWRFALHQYDIVGEGNANIAADYAGYIDLFGWATSGYHDASDDGNRYYMPYSTSTEYDELNNSYGYGPWYLDDSRNCLTGNFERYDWGVFNSISNGGDVAGKWRTLTQDEWTYLLNHRAGGSVADVDNALFCMATVCDVKGMVLFPDDYVHPAEVSDPTGINQYAGAFSDNDIRIEAWRAMEKAGAVFLPAAGSRNETALNHIGLEGLYWSTDSYSQHAATALRFYDGYTNTAGYVSNRCLGYSVRLVQDL